MTEKLLSVKEVAEWLSVSTQTVLNLLTKGEIKGARVGNLWRVPPAEVKAYLQRQGSFEG